ncbi:MAG TPA: hypothetical protein VK167_07375 [Flavipsychrobacter sp.]|nr:hypothetical protein [Flavipsychrobacter sp.]
MSNANLDFNKAIGDSKIEGVDIIKDNMEVLLDSVLNEGILKDIPIIGNLVGVAKAYGSFRERFFLKKIILFLHNVSSVSQQEKEEFEIKHLTKESDKLRFYEKLLIILGKCDDLDKADIISSLFLSLIDEKINTHKFIRAVTAVEKVNIELLPTLIYRTYSRNSDNAYNIDVENELANCGLLQFQPFHAENFITRFGEDTGLRYYINETEIGQIIIRYHNYKRQHR